MLYRPHFLMVVGSLFFFTTDQQRTEYNLSVSFARAKKLYINSVISLSMSLLVVRVFSMLIPTR